MCAYSACAKQRPGETMQGAASCCPGGAPLLVVLHQELAGPQLGRVHDVEQLALSDGGVGVEVLAGKGAGQGAPHLQQHVDGLGGAQARGWGWRPGRSTVYLQLDRRMQCIALLTCRYSSLLQRTTHRLDTGL